MVKQFLTACLISASALLHAQQSDEAVFRSIFDETMLHGEAYDNLHYLCKNIGHRLAGSPQADMAVRWSYQLMQQYDFDTVWLQEVTVPHWVRGEKEYGEVMNHGQVNMLALGGSIATPLSGIIEEVIEVKDFDELKALGADKVRGKIVFFNHVFPQNVVNSFDGYGLAGPYRWRGANEASKLGAKAVIIRSVGSAHDDFAHTGSTGFDKDVTKVPCAALSAIDADFLHAALQKEPDLKFKMIMNCKMLDSVTSYNVIAEIKGSVFPNEIIVVGGHLDSWDVNEGAHDDGAGVVQTIEVLRAFVALGFKPKHTIRFVLFANEENGTRGANKYAEEAKAKNEKHIFALESDAGGFTPRGFGFGVNDTVWNKIYTWRNLFKPYGGDDFVKGGGDADIDPLHEMFNTPVAGLRPDTQRYFDVHHAVSDVFEAVNIRELKLGAINMAALLYIVDKYGL